MVATDLLYGTTASGSGTIFSLTPSATSATGWALTTVHSFKGAPGGAGPRGSLIMDGSGNLYGVTLNGGGGLSFGECDDGAFGKGCGTVYALVP